MRLNFKLYTWVLAAAVSAGLVGGTARAVAFPAMNGQDHEEHDYSKNKNYQLGMREGKVDKVRNRDHYKKRRFKRDEDRQAYEAGYQRGHEGEHHEEQH